MLSIAHNSPRSNKRARFRLRPFRGEAVVRPIGQLSPTKMAEVDEALKHNLALS